MTLVLLAAISGASVRSSPLSTPDLVDLYAAGQNDSSGIAYDCFRIPSLVRTRTGSLVLFAEGRRGGCGDQGDVRIVSRRSDDDGSTWGPIMQVLSEKGHTIGNPAPVADLRTGIVWLLFARDDDELFVAKSTDDGWSFRNRTNVTLALKPNPDPKAWAATGPPGGVQLASGRLITAAYYNRPDGQTRAYAVYSDDAGATWKRGSDVEVDATPGAQVWGGGESQLVEFGSKGGLALLIRARTAFVEDVGHNHALAFSWDGGETWSNSTRMSGIETVYCEGSIASTPAAGDLLVSSPSTSNGVRANLTVWLAKHDSPTEFEYLMTLYSGSAAYSSMLAPITPGGDYINAFEREGSRFISLARFKYEADNGARVVGTAADRPS